MIHTSGDPRGDRDTSIFIHFFDQLQLQNNRSHPLWELVDHSEDNPGSTTAHVFIFVTEQCKYMGDYYPIGQEVSILLDPPLPPNSPCKTKFAEDCYILFENCEEWIKQYYGLSKWRMTHLHTLRTLEEFILIYWSSHVDSLMIWMEIESYSRSLIWMFSQLESTFYWK